MQQFLEGLEKIIKTIQKTRLYAFLRPWPNSNIVPGVLPVFPGTGRSYHRFFPYPVSLPHHLWWGKTLPQYCAPSPASKNRTYAYALAPRQVDPGALPSRMEDMFRSFAEKAKARTSAELRILNYYINRHDIDEIPDLAFISIHTVKNTTAASLKNENCLPWCADAVYRAVPLLRALRWTDWRLLRRNLTECSYNAQAVFMPSVHFAYYPKDTFA